MIRGCVIFMYDIFFEEYDDCMRILKEYGVVYRKFNFL